MQEEKTKKGSALKIILIILLVIVIVLLLLVIAGFTWFWFADPLGLRTAIFNPPTIEESGVPYDHPLLSEDQENLLRSIGVDPRVLPTEITPEMENCAREKLGDQRVSEIIQGATPTTMDLLKAQSCF